MSALFVVGAGLFFLGVALTMGVLFASGGANKSAQFRVLGELFSGKHGANRRAVLVAGLCSAGLGAVLLFAGVAAGDQARARRCADYCKATGFEKGAIGPSDDPARRVVSCTCTSADGRRQQLPADDVPGKR